MIRPNPRSLKDGLLENFSRILFISVFILVFLLSALTPMAADDFSYSFSFSDETRIHSILQIVPSMAAHRTSTNGRVIVHGLVQLLLLLPRPIFCVLNGLNAVLLCYLLKQMISTQNKTQTSLLILMGLLVLFCFLPAFGENCLWLDGTVNYAWGATIALFFLSPFLLDYLKQRQTKTWYFNILFIPLSFAFGTWSENTSLVFIFLAFFYYSLSYKQYRKFKIFPLLWIIAALFGYLFLMTAPATAGRASASGVSVLGYNFRVVFRTAQNRLLIPLITYAILFAVSISYQVEKKTVVASVMFFLAGLLNLFSYIFAAYLVSRHLFAPIFLFMLAAILLFAGLFKAQKPIFFSAALASLIIIFLLNFPVGILDIALSQHKQQLREKQISDALMHGESTIVLDNYIPFTAYGIPFELDGKDPEVWPNVSVSAYYGLDSVLGAEPESEEWSA